MGERTSQKARKKGFEKMFIKLIIIKGERYVQPDLDIIHAISIIVQFLIPFKSQFKTTLKT